MGSLCWIPKGFTWLYHVQYVDLMSLRSDAAVSGLPVVAVVGLGVMGAPMARHILAADPPVAAEVRITGRGDGVRTGRERCAELLDAGATWCETGRELAEGADVLVSVLPELTQLTPLLEGPDGILAAARSSSADSARPAAGPVLVVCSTVSAVAVRELAARIEPAGWRVVDAPVSGGEDGAKAGTLSVMVGGGDGAVAVALPVLAATGNPVHLGPSGAGQVAKACNQLVVASTVLALGEAAVLADRSGIDVATLFELFAGGYAGSRMLDTRGGRIAREDYSPSGVAEFMRKDLASAAAVAADSGTDAVLLPAVRAAFEELIESGHGASDVSVTRRFVAERGRGRAEALPRVGPADLTKG